jgi:hypothetical protein
MKLRNKILVSVAGHCGVALVLWISAWVHLFTRFPSEQVYVASTSPDGGKVARFSVKCQGDVPLATERHWTSLLHHDC